MAVLLIGCGRMGGALLRGWIGREEVAVVDPAAGEMEGVRRLSGIAEAASLPQPLEAVIAVKPQVLPGLLPALKPLAEEGALIVSIAAGATLARLEEAVGAGAKLARAMPNTPAAVGRGVTALIAAASLDSADRARVAELFGWVGETLWLEREDQMDAVTALSGSGPAYFFRFAEALARAGAEQDLAPDLAMKLARATLIGAGALAEAREEELEALRTEVTSPGGTTAAALAMLEDKLDALVGSSVAAAAARSRELG